MNQWVFKSVFLIVSLSADKLMKLKTKKNIQLLFMKISGNRHCLNLYLVCFVAQFNPPPPPHPPCAWSLSIFSMHRLQFLCCMGVYFSLGPD